MDHPELQKLRQFGVTEEQIDSFKVLCLPENLLAAARPQDLLDSQDAADLAKRLREAGISCGTSLELAPEAATLQRTGGDLWLGIVWVLQPAVAPALVKTMSRKLKSWMERIHSSGKVHVRLRIRHGSDIAEIGYAGDGKTLSSLLEGLKSQWKEP
jgi:hypothetical protein